MRCHYRIFLKRAIFEKELTALHVVHSFYLFNRYVFILLTKLRTETKTVPSTWYIFNVQGCTHTDFHICALYFYWLTWGTGPTNIHQRKGHCLMTSAHPTSTPHNPCSNSHHDECTTFLITQLPKNKRKFIPKVLKVHINRIQLYLYSTSPRNRYKLKP